MLQPSGHGSVGSRVCWWVPVIHPWPETVGIIASISPTLVGLKISLSNWEFITERLISLSPICIFLFACKTAIRVHGPVPHGERSIFPGWITTVFSPDEFSPSLCKAPAIWQNEICFQSGCSGWWKPNWSFAALVIRKPNSTMWWASSGKILNPRSSVSTITKLSPPKAVST